eukprot:5223684-Pyramimonas_sp.AAC.1
MLAGASNKSHGTQIRFASAALRSTEWTEIVKRTKVLHESEVDFPSVFKKELHDRKIQDITNNGKIDVIECTA